MIISIICLLVISSLLLYIGVFQQKENHINLKYNRFEQVLFSITEKNASEKIKNINTDFGVFNKFFENEIMQKHLFTDQDYIEELLRFTQHPDMREAFDSVSYNFSNISDIKEELNSGFSNFSMYFPDYILPDIYTYFGGFRYGVICYENTIGIGLENFLGSNSKFYDLLEDPDYIIFHKNKDFITSNAMEVWCNHLFGDVIKSDFLSNLIYKGKVMVFIDHMLPKKDLEDKFGFSELQMNWVINNEANIWSHFIENDLLYSTRERDFRSIFNYAPFVKGMPKEAPARLGYYIGYRIVSSYLNVNELTIQQLMIEKDYNKILNKSKYKPRK